MLANAPKEKNQVIVLIARKVGWLDARELVESKGGLQSNRLHDRYLVETEEWKDIRSLYPAWAREVLVYPEKDGQFRKGTDVVDASRDGIGRKWILPASCIPEQAIGVKGVALFVDPDCVEINSRKVAILSRPKSIVVLAPFIQANAWGKMDERTRVPLAVLQDPDGQNNRYLWRVSGAGVRPLVRGWYDVWFTGRLLFAVLRHDYSFGAAGVAQAEPIKAVNQETLRALLRDAKSDIIELSKTMGQEKFRRLHRLIRRLEPEA